MTVNEDTFLNQELEITNEDKLFVEKFLKREKIKKISLILAATLATTVAVVVIKTRN